MRATFVLVLLSAVGVASYTLPTARVCRASRHAPLQAAEAPAWMKAVQERNWNDRAGYVGLLGGASRRSGGFFLLLVLP